MTALPPLVLFVALGLTACSSSPTPPPPITTDPDAAAPAPDAAPQPTCDDGVQNGEEAGVDCGGDCADCVASPECTTGIECASGLCQHNACQPVPWQEEWRDEYEQPYPARWQNFSLVTSRYLKIVHHDTDTDALDPIEAALTTNYAITSDTDPAFAGGVAPTRVGHSKILYKLRPSWIDYAAHTLYIELPQPMQSGHEYRLDIAPAVTQGSAPAYQGALAFSDRDTHNDHIRVNHYGFLPDAGMKIAYVGAWLGTLGALDIDADMTTFHVIDEVSGQVAFTGTPSLRKRAGEPEGAFGWTNMHGEDVYELDFSALSADGRYFISVPGLGRSFMFRIGPDVYESAFYVAARGLYHQRCGIVIAPPHSLEFRPIACHTQPVQLTSLKLIDTVMGGGPLDPFVELPLRTTGETADWTGGLHDAGDYDRRAQHMTVSDRLLDLYEMAPDRFTDGQLDIPESGNGIPDIVDEAAWIVDFFLQLQDPIDGGVRGGIESEAHPDFSEAPWEDSLNLYAYAKDEKSSLMFAAVAAQLSRIYAELGHAARASLMLDRAELAWTYALSNGGASFADDVAWAAAELFKTTGSALYRDAFSQNSVFTTNLNARLAVWGQYDQHAASWAYVTTHIGVDTTISDAIAASFVVDAEEMIYHGDRYAYRFYNEPWMPAGGYAATYATPRGTEGLAKAHALTGDARYYDHALANNDFYHGGQPTNMVFMTGMGYRSEHHPFYIATLHDGIDMPYPGISSNGPIACANASYEHVQRNYTPTCGEGFPTLHSWPGAMSFAMIGEGTPQETQIFMILASGYFLP